MEISFDIAQDEMPVFLAETEDHLQILDNGLIRLERQESDSDLIQQIFRAAHTLKGSAGMIGHQRLVELTHALEMAFDGIRKNELLINSHLVDICLEAVDALRLLRDEVVNGQTSNIDASGLVRQINAFIQHEESTSRTWTNKSAKTPLSTPPATDDLPSEEKIACPGGEGPEIYRVTAKLSPHSSASAARAFQLMLALQEMGEILDMVPSAEQIDTAVPVTAFSARLQTSSTPEEIRHSLGDVPEEEDLTVGLDGIQAQPAPAQPADASEETLTVLPDANMEIEPIDAIPEEIALFLGEYLVTQNYITEAQLQQGLAAQTQRQGKKSLIGQVLVELGMIQQNILQQVIAELLQQQRKTIKVLLQAEPDQKKLRAGDKTIRTSVERLDTLMNLVGELITDRNRLFKLRGNIDSGLKVQQDVSALIDTVAHIGRITDQLQEEVMRIRMLPVSNIFNKFPRMVRDLAQKVNKEINLVIQGQDTELDRSVIEEINDPLIHLLRNAIDHGIESAEVRTANGKPASGTIRLTARHEHGRIFVTVEDDGAGINLDRLKQSAVQKGFLSELEARQLPQEKAIDLIFLSGLSTAKKLTEVSGRGVGMDIVRTNIEKINGTVLVETSPGAGTQFQIILPLTLAIVPTLLVRVGSATFAIPLIMVSETVRIEPRKIKTIKGGPVILLRDEVLPILKISELFGVEEDASTQKYRYIVVVSSNKMRFGLVVDALVGEEEVVVKSLSSILGNVAGISSAAILGDGQVSLIVDVPGLVKLAGLH